MEDLAVLILDESINGLDKQRVDDMRKLFMELCEQEKTILIASHNREDIEVLCDVVYEMDTGVLTKVSEQYVILHLKPLGIYIFPAVSFCSDNFVFNFFI